MSPCQEVASILLEIFAFFLVTTDLYGSKQLADKHSALLKSLSRPPGPIATIFMIGLCFSFAFLSLDGITHFFLSYLFRTGKGLFQSLSDLVDIVLIGVFAGTFLLSMLGAVIFLLILPGFVAKFFLRRKPLEGLMLAIGTFFFIASRAIPLIHFVPEVWRHFLHDIWPQVFHETWLRAFAQ